MDYPEYKGCSTIKLREYQALLLKYPYHHKDSLARQRAISVQLARNA